MPAPLVVFAHMPLWPVYPAWGWGAADSAEAIGTLRHFGSVSVLNGQIHQIQQKVEGSITFYAPGTYAYCCSIHPVMVDTIIVQ